MKLIKAGVLGGLVLFAWSSISWMALPWHQKTFKSFKIEPAIMVAMKAGSQGSGVYMMPSMDKKADKKKSTDPFAFVVYNDKGYGDMNKRMAVALVENILTALLAAFFLSRCKIKDYGSRVLTLGLLGLFAGLAAHVPNLIWWGHSPAFTFVAVADLLIGWTLAGLVMAKVS